MDESGKFPVKYDNVKYDIANFLRKHPGGVNYLNGFRKGEVKKRMEETEHSSYAKYLLREYMVGGRYQGRMEEHDDLEVSYVSFVTENS